MNVHALRSAGWSGLAFVVVVLVTGFLPAPQNAPSIDAAPLTIGAYVDANRTGMLAAGWSSFIAVAFFLWFAVGLFNYQSAAPGEQEGLPIFAFTNGVIASALAIVAGLIQIGMAFHSAGQLGLEIRTMYDLYNISGILVFGPSAIYIFGVSLSGARHASLPNGLVWLGYLVAVLCAISSLSIFFSTGFLALGGTGTLILGLIPFVVWYIVAGIWMIRKKA
jgi:hypothetical protein